MQGGKFSSATLRKRLLGNHFGGNTSGSTVRLTLGSLLLFPLGLVPCLTRSNKIRFTADSEARLTEWMCSSLLVTYWAAPSSFDLVGLETEIMARLNPPLDLARAAASPHRCRIRALRKRTVELAKSRPCN